MLDRRSRPSLTSVPVIVQATRRNVPKLIRGRSARTLLLVLALVGAACQSGGGGQSAASSEETRLEQARREYPEQVAEAVLVRRIPAPEGFDACISRDLGEERFGELLSGSGGLEGETDVAALCLLELGVAPGSLQEAGPMPVGEPEPLAGPRPVLENLGVNFGPWNPETNMAGDFLFTNDATPPGEESNPDFNRVFFEFPGIGGWTYYLPADTNILAVSDGVVEAVCYQKTPYAEDYSITVVPHGTPPEGVVRNKVCDIVRGSLREGTRWMISYDHVVDVRVRVGDVVEAGDVLGKPVKNYWNTSLGFWEIEGPMRNRQFRDSSGKDRWEQTWFCPVSFLEPSLRPKYEARVTQLMRDWETFKGDADIYNEANQVAPGCTMRRVDPNEWYQ